MGLKVLNFGPFFCFKFGSSFPLFSVQNFSNSGAADRHDGLECTLLCFYVVEGYHNMGGLLDISRWRFMLGRHGYFRTCRGFTPLVY